MIVWVTWSYQCGKGLLPQQAAFNTMPPRRNSDLVEPGAVPPCTKQQPTRFVFAASKQTIARMQRLNTAGSRIPGVLATVDEHTTRGLQAVNQESGGGFKGLAIFAVCLVYAAVMFTLASVISAVIMLVGGQSKEKRKQLFVAGKGTFILRSDFKKSVQLKTHQG